MIDSKPDCNKVEASRGRGLWIQRGILAAVCALVIGVYAYTAHPGIPVSGRMSAADNYYNLLVQGFRAGQLNLKKEVPPALARLADPYAPSAYASYGLEAGDMSYYNGKLYLYFGVTPAVVLFWPYAALTGQYLLQKDAVVIFCLIGFLASVGLLYALWRRYFGEVNVAVGAIGGLALGLATGVPIMLTRCDVYEVSIGCGYALTMLALAAIWCAMHEPERRCWWLAAASVAYGLAAGARPSLVFGAVILLVPVVQAWRERRMVFAPLLAATIPIALIGLGLMLYNVLRFGSPFEFGIRYQLAGEPSHLTQQFFSLRYLWFNFRVYFLEPARWRGQFPFVDDIRVPPLPPGQGGVEHAFGVLTNIPLVWLALAVPLAWRGRSADVRSTLCGSLVAVAVLFGTAALMLSLCCYTVGRYEVDFLPALMLLAVVGMLGLERALADRPAWWRAGRCCWGLLLAFSVAFNLLASVEQCAEWHCDLGAMLFRQGQVQEAVRHWERALRIKPDYAEAHNNLAGALFQAGQVQEAIEHWEQALRIKPDYADTHHRIALALVRQGRLPEAIRHWERALRIKPDFAEAHNNLGLALMGQGKAQEAIGHYEQALRIHPNDAVARTNLGLALVQQGRVQEAIDYYEQALRIEPNLAEAHYNLGLALEKLGHTQEAIQHYEQALRIKPDFLRAQNALARARAVH